MGKSIKIIGLTVGAIIVIFILIPMIFGFRIGYYKKLQYNYDAISAISSAIAAISQIIGIVIGAYLTFLIIKQTQTLANMQLKMERFSAINQENLQKRQMKIDLFDRRIPIFEALLKIFTNIEILIKVQREDELLEKRIDGLIRIYQGMKSHDEKNFDIFPLYRTEFLFTGELLQYIRVIIDQFSEMGARINVLSMSKDYMDTTWRKDMYYLILKNAETILSYRNYIDKVSKTELNIAGFER